MLVAKNLNILMQLNDILIHNAKKIKINAKSNIQSLENERIVTVPC